jgi:hypothetical protein
VLAIGLKKFTNSERSTEIATIPVRIKAKFFKFLKGFLVAIRLIINNIIGSKKTGPISIKYFITLEVIDI